MANDKAFETDKLDDSEFNLVPEDETGETKVEKVKKKRNYSVILFVFSFLIAMTVWLYVSSLEDDNYEKTITLVPVSIVGTDELERNNNMSVISGYDNTVTVTLKGKRADVNKYSASNIYAYVDVSTIDSSERRVLPVVIEPIADITVSVVTPSEIAVYADVIGTKEVELVVKPYYTIDGNYFIDETQITKSVETVTVSGPESVLATISYAVAEANIGKVTSSVKSNTNVYLVNDKGTKIQNPYLNCDTDMVVVNIPVNLRKEVGLYCDYDPDEFEGYEVELSLTDDSIMVSGEVLAVNAIEEILVFTLKKSHFDFTQGSNDELTFIQTVTITLPEGISFVGEHDKVVVEATITRIPEVHTTEAPETEPPEPEPNESVSPSPAALTPENPIR